MNASFASVAGPLLSWLADYYLAATIVFLAALIGWRLMRQPAHRMAVAWAVMIELVVLAVACALPFWPKVSLFTAPASQSGTKAMRLVKRDKTVQPAFSKKLADAETAETAAPAKEESPKLSETPVAVKPSWTLAEAISAGYLAGVGLIGLWLGWGAVATALVCRRARSASVALHVQLSEIVQSNRRMPRLLISSHIDNAVALGVFRPTIVLPAELAENGSPQTLRAVLLHEYAHIRHGDLRQLALGRCLLLVFFVHPLFWWLRRAIRGDQELLADAVAAGDNRHDYAEALLHLIRNSLRSSPLAASAAVGIWEGPSQLSRRITMLLDETIRIEPTGSRRLRYRFLGIFIVLGAACSLLTLQPARSADDQKKPAVEGRLHLVETPTQENGKSDKENGDSGPTKLGEGTLVRSDDFVGAISMDEVEDANDFFILPGFDLLLRPKKLAKLNLTEEQKNKLKGIKASNLEEDKKFAAELEKKKTSREETTKLHMKRYYERRKADREKVEAILTAEQIRIANEMSVRQMSAGYLFGPGALEKIGVTDLTKQQNDELKTLREQVESEYGKNVQEKKKDMLAVINPQQRTQLQESLLNPEQSMMFQQEVVQVEGKSYLIPTLNLFPDFSAEEVQKKLNLTEGQKKMVQEILGGSVKLSARIAQEIKRLSPEEQKKLAVDNDSVGHLTVTGTWTTGTFTLAGGEEATSADDRKKREAELFKKMKEERQKERQQMTERPLVKVGLELLGRFEAALTPEQLAKYKDMAFDNVHYTSFMDPLILHEIGLSDQQTSSLRRIMKESEEKIDLVYDEIAGKMLKVLTAPQQDKLRKAVIEQQEAAYMIDEGQGKAEDKAEKDKEGVIKDKVGVIEMEKTPQP